MDNLQVGYRVRKVSCSRKRLGMRVLVSMIFREKVGTNGPDARCRSADSVAESTSVSSLAGCSFHFAFYRELPSDVFLDLVPDKAREYVVWLPETYWPRNHGETHSKPPGPGADGDNSALSQPFY
jgi:hypothetical protein